MGGGVITSLFYAILSVALFFEIFLLLTFISRPARHARARACGTGSPSVALIVPCYNEERTAAQTARSILGLDYPPEKLRLVLVNDGSTDGTRAVLETFRANPRVTIIHQENGGKHTALNAGIAAAGDAEFVGCVDADSHLSPDALARTIACFARPKVAAAFSSIAIGSPRGMLEHMQGAEYLMGSYFRHALTSINAFFVTPGPFSLYRRAVLAEVGGFRFGQQTEDMEMAMRLLKHGYVIENAPGALVTTRAQDTLGKLIRQRMRWASGYFRNIWFDYRDLLGARYGFLGLFVLPMSFLAPFLIIMTTVLSLYLLGTGVAQFFIARDAVPLTWVFSSTPHYLSWFYAPASTLLILTVVVIALAALTAFIGKRISGTRERVAFGVFSYTLLYGLVAPLWFARSIIDVSTGTRRGWRHAPPR